MSTNHEVTLNPGDSAVIVRHEDGENAGFEIEIYHHPSDKVSEDDLVSVSYTHLTLPTKA